jgi:hypothetical protein
MKLKVLITVKILYFLGSNEFYVTKTVYVVLI